MTIEMTAFGLCLVGMIFNYCLGGVAAVRFAHKDPTRPRGEPLWAYALIYALAFILWPAVLWVYANESGEPHANR